MMAIQISNFADDDPILHVVRASLCLAANLWHCWGSGLANCTRLRAIRFQASKALLRLQQALAHSRRSDLGC